MPALDYTYTEHSRRPATLLALSFSAAMLAGGVAFAAPWYFLVPVILAVLMLLWMVLVNRKSGISLTGDQFSMFAGQWHQSVPTARIRSVKVVHWSDGAPTITLWVANGPDLDVPGYCFGSGDTLINALASRNIPIDEKGRSTPRAS
jgi:hypothetical protein